MRLRYCFIVFFLLALLTSCKGLVFKNDLPKILGVNDVSITESQGIDEFGGFGEGYTFEIYTLSVGTLKAFIALHNKELPDKKEEGKEWQKYGWSKTPVDSVYFANVLSVVFDYKGIAKIEERLDEIRKILKKTYVYYSFYYNANKEVKDYIEDVQFFILDIEMANMYIVECNM